MRKIIVAFKLFVLIAFVTHPFKLFAQIINESDKFKPTALTGWFIMLRDSIPNLPPSDEVPPFLAFKVFFIQQIDTSIIENVKKYNVPKRDTITFIYGDDYVICNHKDRIDYLDYLARNGFDKIKYQSPFSWDNISQDLLNSKNRFISIYKGTINVVGPFWSCIYPFFHMPIYQQVYEYIPPFTKLTYLDTIVF